MLALCGDIQELQDSTSACSIHYASDPDHLGQDFHHLFCRSIELPRGFFLVITVGRELALSRCLDAAPPHDYLGRKPLSLA